MKLKTMFNTTMMTIIATCVIHFYFGFNPPIIIQAGKKYINK
jgi:hypothetical protein